MTDRKPAVIVTGSEGAIGSALCHALEGRFRVVGVDRECEESSHESVAVDLTSDESVRLGLAAIKEQHGNRIASVVHLAAYFDLSGEPNPLYDAVNVDGTRRLLSALQGFDVEQFVYASTMLVHAPTRPGLPIAEDAPLEANWPYPQSKLKTEEAIREHHGQIPYVLLRIAGMYTDRCGSAFLAHQIRRIYERHLAAHLYAADPAIGQSFIHIEDVIDAFVRLVERRESLPPELPLLVGEPQGMSYEALQNRLAFLIHGETEWETRQVPGLAAKAGAWLQHKAAMLVPDVIDQGEEPFIKPYMVEMADDHFEIDSSRAHRLLGWESKHSLHETLPKMVEALRADPLAWYHEHDLTPPVWLKEAEQQQIPGDQLLRGHEASMREARASSRWAHFANMGLGAWLVTSPPMLAYGDAAMVWNDIASGAAVMIFALLSLSGRMSWARFATAAAGTWLLFAPLVFWTPSAAAYLNDTLVGTLVIGFALLLPPVPGVSPVALASGPDIPPGWDYNPSGWLQRLPIIALAFVGLFVSRYLAAYQLGHIDSAWDPLFGDGTERIITSEVSKAWPVPDAGLGAVTYILEILTGFLGDRRRWRTAPWVVILFGLMIVPLGAVSIFFIIIQPIVIGTWCTLCLVAALAMLLQIPYSFDELLASGQFLLERRRQGQSLVRAFLFGDTIEGGSEDPRDEFAAPARTVIRESLGGGVNLPWSLAASLAVGIWLMCTRLSFGTIGAQADSDHLLGALIITVSISALAEMARPLRFINILFGIALMGAPLLFDGGTPLADWAGVLAGVLLIVLSVPRGTVRNQYGSWNGAIV